MKSLLSAIQAQLQSDLDYVRASDVFVTEDEEWIPAGAKSPAVGLKDGQIAYAIETGNQESDTLHVDVITYVQLHKPGAGIMGDASADKKGVLDITADIKASLTNNMLSDEVDVAVPVSESASARVVDVETKEEWQMKKLTMRYERFDV